MNECYVATVKDGQWVVSLTLKDAHADTADYKMLVSDDPSDENVALLKKYVASRAPPAAAILEDEDYRKFFTRAKVCPHTPYLAEPVSNTEPVLCLLAGYLSSGTKHGYP